MIIKSNNNLNVIALTFLEYGGSVFFRTLLLKYKLLLLKYLNYLSSSSQSESEYKFTNKNVYNIIN